MKATLKALLAPALLLAAMSAFAQQLSGLPLDEQMALPEKPHFFGSNQGLAGVFGLLGGLAVSSAVEDSRDKIKIYMEKAGIDIRQIVLAEYRKAAASAPALAMPETGAPYRARLDILSYGISARRPFADEYKPWLRIRLQVLDRDGRAEFDDGAFINNRADGTPVYPLDKFFGDPEVLRAALARAAELASAETVKKVVDRYGPKQ